LKKNTSLTDRNFGRQSHIIVNARYALTRAEIDLVLMLITSIKKEDEDFKDYEFTIEDLKQKSGRAWHSKQLYENIKSLMSKPIELPTDNPKKRWSVVNWFSFFEYNDGIIRCRFDKGLKPYLLEIKERFIISDIRHMLPMKSSYSKRMYLLLKEYAKIGHRTWKVEELQDILKVPKSLRDRYDNFKRQVLKKAEADINKFTDLEVELKERKLGRKVIEITYEIRKNHTDLKTFISFIRELYANEALYPAKDGRMLKCSDEGLLYYSDKDSDFATLDKDTAMKAWEWLHENRKKLYCFQPDLLDYMEEEK
jgi:plasmid replication initiation protein